MRYYYEKPDAYAKHYGELYICDHVLYSRCTLFRIGDERLTVIQQKFHNKITWWGWM